MRLVEFALERGKRHLVTFETWAASQHGINILIYIALDQREKYNTLAQEWTNLICSKHGTSAFVSADPPHAVPRSPSSRVIPVPDKPRPCYSSIWSPVK